MNRIIFLIGCFFLLIQYGFGQEGYDEMLQEYYKGTVPLMQPATLYKKMQAGETIHLLDTRENREFKVSALKGATHVGFLFFTTGKVEKVDKDDLIVTYCTIGARSETVGKKLLDNGYTNVYNLYGGIIYWKNQGFPVYHNGKKTEDVHVYSKKWGDWLENGNPQY
jgi:rhodanese-related sulfurtransferase